VVYNGVEISSSVNAIGSDNAFNSCAARKRGGITFANIGQFVPWKKQMLFLQVAHEITDRLPHARFMLVGDDLFGRNSGYKDRLLNYLKRLNLPERFVHIGWQEDMTKVWENVDCLVHAADREPFGRIIIEAMAARVPVIAVDSAGPSEIISDGITGLLVRASDPKQLQDAMLRMASEPNLRRTLADAAYERVRSVYTVDNTARRIREIYENILAS
jgi:glycosyltransferase involved in cell wall biosynthesis